MARIALAVLVVLGATAVALDAATAQPALTVTVCQRTKSSARPYVRVVVRSQARLRSHLARHADIVPARGACPKVALTPTRRGIELTANLNGSGEKPSRDPARPRLAAVRALPGLGALCHQGTG